MAQTSGAMSGAAFTIAAQFGGTGTYTDISGSSQSIEMPELEIVTGEAYTPDSDTAIITYGKQKPFEITVNIVYTEVDTEAYKLLKDAWTGKTLVSLKWQPKNSTGETYTTSAHRITKRQLPGGDASSGDTIICTFTMLCASVTETL